jgi:hypothetical protein
MENTPIVLGFKEGILNICFTALELGVIFVFKSKYNSVKKIR